jgi:dienelactone hydrolase
MNALMVGRTMIGERVWDVSRAIDLALTYPEIDGERILCTGNSGGGTTTYYAAAMDERIKVAMPSCAVCTFKSSICNIYHCVCNYIPRISKYMEMGDVAAAIAPRKLIVINGKLDNIFPQAGVEECFDTIKAIYTAAGVPDHCALATGEGGHRYYAAEAWGAFDAMSDWDI